VIADGTSDVDRRSRGPRRPRKVEEEETPAPETKTEEVSAETTAAAPEASSDPVPTEGAPSTADKPPEKQEPPTRTYEEFLASKPKLESDLHIKRREVQNDESQFRVAKELSKPEEKNPYAQLTAEEKAKKDKVKKDKAKHISLDEFTAAANGGGAGKGGYRGPRRGGRGGDAQSLTVTDTNFPALTPKEKK